MTLQQLQEDKLNGGNKDSGGVDSIQQLVVQLEKNREGAEKQSDT